MTTPPAKPPPDQLPPKLWSLIKEIFFNRTSIAGFIRRHKFSAFLCLTNTALFLLGMLLLEFNFEAQSKLVQLSIDHKATVAELKRLRTGKTYEQCRPYLATLEAIQCGNLSPTGNRKPSTRRRHNAAPESNIADKLNAIRDRNS